MIQTQGEYQTKKAIFRTYQIVWYILGVLEALLVFRFLFKMLGANRVGAVNFLYSITDPFALPFYGIFGQTQTGDSVFEWTTLVAMITYALVAYAIVRLFQIIKPTNPTEVEQNV